MTRAFLVTAMVASSAAVLPAGTGEAATIAATLVKTTWTGGPNSNWAHPSPDPSGITYNSRTGQLIIVDGEVEETGTAYPKNVWKGTNLFVTTLGGAQVTTGLNTMAYTAEPTGVGFRPGNLNPNFPERLFITDDNQARLFEVNAQDGVYGNANDTRTSTSIAFTSLGPRNDAEDVAVDLDLTRDGRLLLVDGKGKRVFVFNPGPDRVFNGTGDFVEQTINVGNMGAGDPEGLAYNAARDTVFVLDDPSNKLYEISLTGTLLNTVTLPFKMKSGAGLAFAPPSGGGSGMNGYIVDRGVDNDTNQDLFNDGRLYEISIPGLGNGGGTPPANTAPTVSAGPDRSVVRPNAASLDGTVTDSTPTGTLTSTWSRVSGPGTVTFANANNTDTTATFSATGTYVLRLTGSDGSLSATDDVSVTVTDNGTPPPGNGVVDAKIVASADDAEQVVSSGAVALASGDLNLPLDGARVQMAGMRFSGVTVPRNATITKAYVQFQADEVSTGPVSLTITGELANDAAGFTTTASSISTRSQTGGVTWSPADWSVLGARTATQQTADISAIVKAIVSQSGWASGNHLVLIVKQGSGTGNRIAESFDGGAAKAPVLHIEYTAP